MSARMRLPHRYKDIDLTDADWEFVFYVHARLPDQAELVADLIREREGMFGAWGRAELGALLWLMDVTEQRAQAEAGLS
jgi:hypothetical protein